MKTVKRRKPLTSFLHYISNKELTDYIPREQTETNAEEGSANRSRTTQTRDNIVNFALNDIETLELPTYEDDYELRVFKGYSYREQISILLHILRIQAYAIRKAVDIKSTIALPYLGRYTYNKYRELSFNIFKRLKDIEHIENIRYIVRTTLGDLGRNERREKRKKRLSIRTIEYPRIKLNESGRKIDIIDERYNDFKR